VLYSALPGNGGAPNFSALAIATAIGNEGLITGYGYTGWRPDFAHEKFPL
jgi:hypothetical protein